MSKITMRELSPSLRDLILKCSNGSCNGNGGGEDDSIIPPEPPTNPDINIDTNGDGIPDLNIDTNGDGIPDLNIDTNGDLIADVNIDTNGDGIPDMNVNEFLKTKILTINEVDWSESNSDSFEFTFNHGLNTSNPAIFAFDDKEYVAVECIRRINNNSVLITNDERKRMKLVILDATSSSVPRSCGIISLNINIESNSWSMVEGNYERIITHNLNTACPLIIAYDENGNNVFLPMLRLDSNRIKIINNKSEFLSLTMIKFDRSTTTSLLPAKYIETTVLISGWYGSDGVYKTTITHNLNSEFPILFGLDGDLNGSVLPFKIIDGNRVELYTEIPYTCNVIIADLNASQSETIIKSISERIDKISIKKVHKNNKSLLDRVDRLEMIVRALLEK